MSHSSTSRRGRSRLLRDARRTGSPALRTLRRRVRRRSSRSPRRSGRRRRDRRGGVASASRRARRRTSASSSGSRSAKAVEDRRSSGLANASRACSSGPPSAGSCRTPAEGVERGGARPDSGAGVARGCGGRARRRGSVGVAAAIGGIGRGGGPGPEDRREHPVEGVELSHVGDQAHPGGPVQPVAVGGRRQRQRPREHPGPLRGHRHPGAAQGVAEAHRERRGLDEERSGPGTASRLTIPVAVAGATAATEIMRIASAGSGDSHVRHGPPPPARRCRGRGRARRPRGTSARIPGCARPRRRRAARRPAA